MYKRFITLGTLLFLVVSLAACGGGSSVSSKKYTIGFAISKLTNPFVIAMDKGVHAEVAKVGNVDLIETNANNDASTQVSQIEDLITKKVDLLILNPVSADGIVPVVRQANSAHIPVITVDRGVNGGSLGSFIETDNVALGKEGVDWIAQELTKRYGSAKGQVVDLQGLRGTTPAENRGKGFHQELQNYPNIQVVATQAADFD